MTGTPLDEGAPGPTDPAAPPAPPAAPQAPASPASPQAPRRLRSLVIGSVIAVVLAVALFVGLGPKSSPSSNPGPAGIGTAAPNFTLPSLTGGPQVNLYALGKERHRPVVLNFFASWCEPCREETPLLARTADAEQAKGSKIQFIGVDTLDPTSSAIPFVQKAGIRYPVVTDDGQVSTGLYGIYGDPQTFFIGAGGRIIGHVRGALKPAVLEQWLKRLGSPTD